MTNILIADNHLIPIGTASYGINASSAPSCESLTISRNHIYMATPHSSGAGIKSAPFIYDNYIELGADGLHAIWASGIDTPGVIKGNHIVLGAANNDGININASNEMVVTGNFIENVTGSGAAIREAGTSNYNIITDNISTGSGGGVTGAPFIVGYTPGGGCSGAGTGSATYCCGNRVRGDQTVDTCDMILYASMNPTEAGATDDFMSMLDHAGSQAEGTEDDYVAIPGALNFHHLRCDVDVAPGVGNDPWTIVAREDGGDLAVTCAIDEANTSCTDVTNVAAVSVGGLLNYDISSAGGDADPDAAASITCSVRLGP